MSRNEKSKSLESWIWDAACSIRRAKDAPKRKDYILTLVFTKRLCDDQLNRIAAEVGSRKKAFQLAKREKKRAVAPLETVRSGEIGVGRRFGLATRARRVRLRRKQPKQFTPLT